MMLIYNQNIIYYTKLPNKEKNLDKKNSSIIKAILKDNNQVNLNFIKNLKNKYPIKHINIQFYYI